MSYEYHPDPNKEDFVHLPVVEIGKARVLDEFQRTGVYQKLHAQLIENLKEKYPYARMLAGTKESHVKKTFQKEITFDRYLRIHNTPENEVQVQMEAREKAGWTAFLYTPAALRQKSE